MARTLKTTGLAADLIACFAVDDDNTTIKEFVNGWTDASTQLTVDTGVLVGTATWQGVTQPYFETTADGSFNFHGLRLSAAGDVPLGSPHGTFVAFAGVSPGYSAANFTSVDSADNGLKLAPDGTIQYHVANDFAGALTAIPVDGTSFSFATNWRSFGTIDFFYGADGTTGVSGLTADGTHTGSDRIITDLLSIGGVGSINRQPHQAFMWAFFNRALTEAEYQTLHDDPFGTLFEAAGDTDAPTVSSASVNTAGSALTVTFNETLAGTTSAGDWTLNGTAATVASTTISGTAVTLTLSGTVYQGETVTLDYTGTTLTDAASNPVATFTARAVTNNSTQAAPVSVTFTLRAKADGNPVASANIAYAIRNSGTALSAAADVSGTAATNASGVITVTDAALSGPLDVTIEVVDGTYAGQTLHAQAVAVD